MFFLYCLCAFSSQFKYILSFSFHGLYVNPVRVCLVILIIWDLVAHQGRIKYRKTGNNKWLIALLIWNLWNCLSVVWAKDTRGLISAEIIIFEAFVFVYYGQKLITTKERFIQLIDTLTLAVFVHNCLGWLEVTRKVYLFSRYSDKYSRLGYPVSTFTNTNNYGFYLALMAIMLIAVFVSTKNIKRKTVGGLLLVSSVLLLIRTGSRGAIIAFLLGVVTYALIMMKNKKMAGRIVLSLLVFGTVILINRSFRNVIVAIMEKAFTMDVNAATGSDFYRMNMYANGMDFFIDSIGLGVGAGNVEFWMEHYGTRFTNYIYNLHNWWLEILVGSGVIVTFYVLYTWFYYYKQLIVEFRMRGLSNYNRLILSGLMSVGGVYAVGCISPSSLYSSEWPWFLLALFFLGKSVFIEYGKEENNK